MIREYTLHEILVRGNELFLPSLSVDCVIFGFFEGDLKVLLLKPPHSIKWALPGGFVFKNEDVQDAAIRVLLERTQMKNIFLKQFHLFGDAGRTRQKHAKKLLANEGISPTGDHWLLKRFVTAGFYALADYAQVMPAPDALSETCEWKSLQGLPVLIIDHKEIIDKALHTLRHQLSNEPVGYNLLPKQFALKDLQAIYESILGKKLDRANFQRKILSYNILDKKEKHFTGNAHKAPYLYAFNKKHYFLALKDGLDKGW